MRQFTKAFIVLFCGIMVLGLAGCKKEKNDYASLILGQWRLTECNSQGIPLGSTWEYSSDGSCAYSYDGFTEIGTYSFSNDDKVVNMTISGTTISAAIEQLDEQKMVLAEYKSNITVRRSFERVTR